MAVTCVLYHDDGDLGTKQATDVYVIEGTSDKATAYAKLVATAPAVKFSKVLDDLNVDVLGPSEWLGMARYNVPQKSPATGARVYAFDTVGGSERVTHGISLVNSYAFGGGNAPDFEGAMNVTVDGDRINVEGVDRQFPVYEWTETMYHDPNDVDAAYIATLKDLAWCTNDAEFIDAKGNLHAVGEVLHKGVSGRQSGDEDWELQYRFAARKNETGLTIGQIANIARQGWQYLWVLYEEGEDAAAGRIVKVPVAVYIHRLYYPGNFGDFKLTA